MKPLSPSHQAFGRAIRELRLERGISQEELAHRAGIDRSYMGGVERGERNASLKNILRVAGALEIPPGKLFARFDQLSSKR